VCYWARGAAADDFLTCLDALFEADADHVRELYRSLWRGVPVDAEDPSAFYALTLSGGQGRATIRDWFESTVGQVQANLAAHFADLDIVRNTPPPKKGGHRPHIPLHALLGSLAPLGKSDQIPAPLASRLIHAALQGTPYPFSVLQRAVQRARAEIGRGEWADLERRDARAALIKGVLNRRKRFLPNQTRATQEVTRDMDPTNKNPGYLLGRLMAVIERMQQTALGEIGASVVDRFFSGASAAPQSAFPRLLKGFRHHARKAKDAEKTRKTAGWLEGQADEILAGLDGFPASLDLEAQGLFVLGYHHQRHWLWMSKEERLQQQNSVQD
jgi:CRISPR-associated protein Csd1